MAIVAKSVQPTPSSIRSYRIFLDDAVFDAGEGETIAHFRGGTHDLVLDRVEYVWIVVEVGLRVFPTLPESFIAEIEPGAALLDDSHIDSNVEDRTSY